MTWTDFYTNGVFILLLFILLVLPFLVIKLVNRLKIQFQVSAYFVMGVLLAFLLSGLIAWWSDYSTYWHLSQLGFDFDTMTDLERYAKVAKGNLDKVGSLESSYAGIGWPVKALFLMAFCLPYLVLIYFGNWLKGHLTR